MTRYSTALLAGLLLVFLGEAGAADPTPAGSYKVTLLLPDERPTFWILKLDPKDAKLTGEVVATREKVPPTTLSEVIVKDGILRLMLEVKGQKFAFEGKVPAEANKKILGTIVLGRQISPAQLEPTTLKTLDPFDVNKEIVNQPATGPEYFEAAKVVLARAADKKATAEEVRAWASKAYKAAEDYGPRWQREVGMQIAEGLKDNEEFAPVAVQYARQAERLLGPGEKSSVQQRVLTVLAEALTRAGKKEDAKEVQDRLAKIDSVTPNKFAGRKGMSDRAVLVELFTGAECPPCVAADLAFDALGKTFKNKEVVLLQYHLHIPGPDPLTNPDTMARQDYYGEDIEGTPTIFFNGKAQAPGGGGADDAQEKYGEYFGLLSPMLETAAKVKLKASATQKGGKVNIAAEAASEDAGDKMHLRLALVEEQVDYQGGNRLAHHHWVVRALPGGATGVALKDKAAKHTSTVDLEELRKKLTEYLDTSAKKMDFRSKARPLELKKLYLVAFVQNDASKEVLQAVQVEVRPE